MKLVLGVIAFVAPLGVLAGAPGSTVSRCYTAQGTKSVKNVPTSSTSFTIKRPANIVVVTPTTTVVPPAGSYPPASTLPRGDRC